MRVQTPEHLRFAAAAGVQLTTFDTAHELQKIAALHPQTGTVKALERECVCLQGTLQHSLACTQSKVARYLLAIRLNVLIHAPCRRAAAYSC